MPSNQNELRDGLSGEERLIARYFRPLATAPSAFGLGDDAAAPGVAFLHEELACRNVIREGIELFLALALGVPAVALVLAPAHVRNRVDEAAVDER